MKESTITIRENASGRPEFGRMIISVRQTNTSYCEVVIGYPGLPNVVQQMYNGDAVLYETTQDGILEVRVTALNSIQAEFLISQVSPRFGIIAGALEDDPNNSPFNDLELKRIKTSIESLKNQLKISAEFAPEQLSLINRKLDEIASASQRLGRKDWINYVAGTLTAMCISASFAPETTKHIFTLVNSAFSWLFTNSILLIP